jgi:hypothetical protein
MTFMRVGRQLLMTVTAIVAFWIGPARESVVAADSDGARYRYSLTKTELHRIPRFVLKISDVPDPQ